MHAPARHRPALGPALGLPTILVPESPDPKRGARLPGTPRLELSTATNQAMLLSGGTHGGATYANSSLGRHPTGSTKALRSAAALGVGMATPSRHAPAPQPPFVNFNMSVGLGGGQWTACCVTIPTFAGAAAAAADSSDSIVIKVLDDMIPPASIALKFATIAGARLAHDASRALTLGVIPLASLASSLSSEAGCVPLPASAKGTEALVLLKATSAAELEVVSDAIFDAVHRFRRAAAFQTSVAVLKRVGGCGPPMIPPGA